MSFEHPAYKIALLIIWIFFLLAFPRFWALSTASLAVFHIAKCQVCHSNISKMTRKKQRKLADEKTKGF